MYVYTHIHTDIYIYMYVYICVCVYHLPVCNTLVAIVTGLSSSM